MEKSDFFNSLSPYIPELSVDLIYEIFINYKIQLQISKPRSSKLGDFKPAINGKGHRISVNGNLNQYEFLITFLHEIAHLISWEQYGRKAAPHGKEWKNIMKVLIGEMISAGVFPEDLNKVLKNEIISGRHNFSNLNYNLVKILEQYSEEGKYLRLEDIPDNSLFIISSGKVMKKGALLRKRYKCLELDTGRYYYVHKLAKINNYTGP